MIIYRSENSSEGLFVIGRDDIGVDRCPVETIEVPTGLSTLDGKPVAGD